MIPLTRARAIEAYGGAERWASAQRLVAFVDASGFALRAKHRPPLWRARISMDVHTPNVRLEPIGRDADVCGVLWSEERGVEVRLEPRDGGIGPLGQQFARPGLRAGPHSLNYWQSVLHV